MTLSQPSQPSPAAAPGSPAFGRQKQHKVACPSPGLLAKGLATGKYEYQDGALFKRCSKCKDHWPADGEFFFANKAGDGLNNVCRACYVENRYGKGEGKK